MKLKIISSGSVGNAYILENENSALLIECGVKLKEIQEAIDFNVFKIKGAVVSHAHLDHSKSMSQVAQLGIPLFASNHTFDKMKMPIELRYGSLNHAQQKQINEFKVSSFDASHDIETLGFVIESGSEKVFFLTDSYKIIWNLSSWQFTCVMIEANYCEDIIKSKSETFINRRRLRSHMSIQTAILTLEKMDLSKCRNIVLLHLSDGLSNEKEFKEKTEKRFGIPVTIATKNQILNLNPFLSWVNKPNLKKNSLKTSLIIA
jgi:phosphoribosyl 1,2-cyclic phosphodiesterase